MRCFLMLTSWPPLELLRIQRSGVNLFKRGLNLERGRNPLSSLLPSPAINSCNIPPAILAGEGTGVRL
jgi:hypothetical protein